jgi:protein gp37
MADRTNIAWTDSSFNPWIGCTKIGPGCDHCYAEADFDKRKRRAKWGAGQERSRTSPHNWKNPIRWDARPFAECPSCGYRGEPNMVSGLMPGGEQMAVCQECKSGPMKPARRRVFCASLGDVFDNEVPAQWRADLFQLIADTTNLDWLILTKRIGNAKTMMADALSTCRAANRDGMIWPLPNVWLGATVCNQAEADRDIPKLLAVPARVRFLSIEPMLSEIDLTALRTGGILTTNALSCLQGKYNGVKAPSSIDWVIAGGESGPKARPAHPDWFRTLRDQCAAAGVPYFHKQNGAHAVVYDRDREDPDYRRCAEVERKHPKGRWLNLAGGHGFNGERVVYVDRVRDAGRLLDGVLHHEFPEIV